MFGFRFNIFLPPLMTDCVARGFSVGALQPYAAKVPEPESQPCP